MKALQTQFDDKRLSNAVATPTCSSCCCCCCCLATSIASSSLLAQRIGKEGERHQVPNRYLLTVISALFIPIVGALVYMGFWTINSLLATCTKHSYEGVMHGSHYDPARAYTVCTNPGSVAIWPLLIIAPMLVLWFLYTRVHMRHPARRALLVTILIAVAFTAELAAGAALILTGVGGIFYLIMVPVVIGWISVWYHRHLGREVKASTSAAPATPALPAYPPPEQHEQNTPPPSEPPQQNPPAASA